MSFLVILVHEKKNVLYATLTPPLGVDMRSKKINGHHIKLSNLANFQNFWTLPHWLAWVRRKCIWLFLHFFQYSPFLLKLVPFSQILTKFKNSNTHFRAFFMLYMNQITKIINIFSDQTRPYLSDPKLGSEDQNSNIFISRRPEVTFFLIVFFSC
jgi:hypothetical protein